MRNKRVADGDDGDVEMPKFFERSKSELARYADDFLTVADLDTTLAVVRQKLKDAGIPAPEISVVYRNLSVETDATLGSASIPTLTSTITNTFKDALRMVTGGKDNDKTPLKIVDDASGVLEPGKLTLLLGPPACGKSTFLKTIAGRTKTSKELRISGELKYNGAEYTDVKQPNFAAFVGQVDNHLAQLTVWETLTFAFVCTHGIRSEAQIPRTRSTPDVSKAKDTDAVPGAGAPTRAGSAQIMRAGSLMTAASGEGILGRVSSIVFGGADDTPASQEHVAEDQKMQEKHLARDIDRILSETSGSGAGVPIVLRLVGLAHVQDTPVGDALIRGLSGGERKRLTTAEMMVGQLPLMLMDEISTGLDSATLFSVIRTLRTICRAMRATVVVTLLQPPPEVFYLFDDVMLMAEGSVWYHGPTTQAVPFTRLLGFDCPERKDVPSYLIELTTARGQAAFATEELKAERAAKLSGGPDGKGQKLVELSEAKERFWAETEAGQAMAAKLSSPSGYSDEERRFVNPLRKRGLSGMVALKTLMSRAVLLMIRNRSVITFQLMLDIVIGTIVGSLYLSNEVTLPDARNFFGLCFFAQMFMMMGANQQSNLAIAQRGVYLKFRDAGFFPTWANVVASAVTTLPQSLLESVVVSIPMYFMGRLYLGAAQYFTFVLVLFCTATNGSNMFRTLGNVSEDNTMALAYGATSLLVLMLLNGFSITFDTIPPWWIWAYWITPFSYSLRAMVINEFTSPAWSEEVAPGQTLGDQALASFGFFTEPYWIWVGVAYLVGLTCVFVGLSIWSLSVRQSSVMKAVLPDDAAVQRAFERREAAKAARMKHVHSHGAGLSQHGAGQSQHGGLGVVPIVGQIMKSMNRSITRGDVEAGEDAADVGHMKFTPITLVWQDLHYFVTNPKAKAKDAPADLPKELELLKGVTGYCKPGVLMALMGGSGAGKTTLMDVIAGRKTVGRITGDITVNGYPKEQKTWSRVMGYVEQMDLHTGGTTVAEAFYFSGRLRLPGNTTDEQVHQRVDEVLELVDMTSLQFSLVGKPGADGGLSQEQRKRLTIGVELVANPAVVFMDEPTSGLDARSAAIVMSTVRAVASSGRAVLVTIHQPSIEIFETFDWLLLLQRGGYTTYFGSLGKESVDLIDYLQSQPGVSPIGAGQNPATWMLEVTGGSLALSGASAAPVDWPQLYKEGELYQRQLAAAQVLVEEGKKQGPPLAVDSQFAQPLGKQFTMLFMRYLKNHWRTPTYSAVKLVMSLACALIYGTLYLLVGHFPNPATLQNVQSALGVLYSCIGFMGQVNLLTVTPIVSDERTVFYRERSASMYQPIAFAAALLIVEIPYLMLQASFTIPIIYFMCGFTITAEKFFLFALIFVTNLTMFTVLGQMLVYTTPVLMLASLLAGMIAFLMNIFNGFVVPANSIPVYWRWLNKLVPTTWAIYGLAAGMYGDDDTPMEVNGVNTTISEFLQVEFGYYYYFAWPCLAILVGYVAFGLLVAGVAVTKINWLRR